jgi:hypothetical protein
MHAKMTRDRKKCFLASLNRVIAKLQEENESLRDILARSREAEAGEQPLGDEQTEASSFNPAATSNHYPAVPLNLQESSAALMTISDSIVVNNEVTDDVQREETDKNKSVPPNLQESSAALMSISNSRIFTVG